MIDWYDEMKWYVGTARGALHDAARRGPETQLRVQRARVAKNRIEWSAVMACAWLGQLAKEAEAERPPQ